MNNNTLHTDDIQQLNDALCYMNIAELRDVCAHYHLSIKGTKVVLIYRIITFVQTGGVVMLRAIPAISKAQKGLYYPLTSNTLMLYGSYKNDAKARAFFKTLIGNHFHFTAFGIDWLTMRWLSGKPPTYAEFATFWQEEYLLRKQKKASPKKEWAYINFMQRFLQQYPTASREEVINAWQLERQLNIGKIKNLLKKFIL